MLVSHVELLLIQIELAQRTVGNDSLCPGPLSRRENPVAHFRRGFLGFHRQVRAATLGLVWPLHGLRAQRHQQIIQCARILRVVVCHFSGRAQHHAPIIGRHFEPRQWLLHRRLDRVKSHVIAQDLQHVQHLDPAAILILDEVVELLQRVGIGPQTVVRAPDDVVAHGAGNCQPITLLLRGQQHPRRRGQVEHIIHQQWERRPAAVPLRQLDQLRPQGGKRGPQCIIEALSRGIQRTTGEIGGLH